MDLKKAKPKKFAPYCNLFPLPIKTEKPFVGFFNGYNVTISDYDEMIDIYFMGNFGKGSLSKSAPNHHTIKDDLPDLVFEQQWENQMRWKENSNCSSTENPKKFLSFYKYHYEKARTSLSRLLETAVNNTNVNTWEEKSADFNKHDDSGRRNANLPAWNVGSDDIVEDLSKDSTTDPLIELTENILSRGKIREINTEKELRGDVIVVDADASKLEIIEARIEKGMNLIKETLSLSLEEAFFLSFALGCLIVKDLNDVQLTVTEMWQKFSRAQVNFIVNYVAYHYYRSKGWTVKSGLKYGGDYLLYKRGPAYYHASYLVQVIDGKKKFSWNELIGMNRLVETFNKDLLLCYVIRPEELTEDDLLNPEILTEFSIDECVVRRWIPTQERNKN